jgi:competence protein ComGC
MSAVEDNHVYVRSSIKASTLVELELMLKMIIIPAIIIIITLPEFVKRNYYKVQKKADNPAFSSHISFI